MNLEKFAALRGEAWARRVLRENPSARPPSSESAWPGKIAEARQLAGALGKPRLLERLAKIIQERASTTWRRLIDG